VNERLQALLNTVRDLSPPIGPDQEGWAARERKEIEWGRSLTVDDFLMLLDWMIDPQRPPDWHAEFPERHLRAYAANVAYFVGRAAVHCRDERLLSRLLDLLGDEAHGDAATEILFDMEKSPEFDVLLDGATDRRVAILGKLAAVAAAEQVARLRQAETSSQLGANARFTIRGVLAEWEGIDRANGGEPGA
jgi:hypothetical protein